MLFSFTSFAQDDKAYENKLSEMFEVSGSEATFSAAIKQMMSMQRQQNPNVSADIWNELEADFLKTSMDDLVTMLIPVYQKHMTLSDLQGLIKFYESPVGKKFAEKTPMITTESMQVGQQWGMKIGQALVEKLKAKAN